MTLLQYGARFIVKHIAIMVFKYQNAFEAIMTLDQTHQLELQSCLTTVLLCEANLFFQAK